MKRHIIEVEDVPPSPSPISNAVVVGNQCWISGQLSIGDDGAYAPGSAKQEAQRAFHLVFKIAEAAKLPFGGKIKVQANAARAT